MMKNDESSWVGSGWVRLGWVRLIINKNKLNTVISICLICLI